jgi:hypothetical protein
MIGACLWAFVRPERKATGTLNDVYGTPYSFLIRLIRIRKCPGNQTVSMGPYEPLRIENRPKQEREPIPKSQ